MNTIRLAKRFTLAVVAISIIILVLFFLPMIYNYCIFPLGRLRHDISIGDEYQGVRVKFEAYAERYGQDSGFQFVAGRTNRDFFYRPIPEAEYLFIYHVNIFDDVQLHVLFDEAGLVEDIEFIGD